MEQQTVLHLADFICHTCVRVRRLYEMKMFRVHLFAGLEFLNLFFTVFLHSGLNGLKCVVFRLLSKLVFVYQLICGVSTV